MTDDGPFEFPCAFPVKVFGRNDDAFRAKARRIVHSHFEDLATDQVVENVSRNGKFVSMTFTVEAQNREGLDNLYRALSSDPQVLMAL